MAKIFNRVIDISKFFVFLFCFLISFYMFLLMHEYDSFSVLAIIFGFLPFFLLLIIYVVNFSFKRGGDNLVLNTISFLSYSTILFILIRSFFDYNMVYLINRNANYYYFKEHLLIIKILLYLIVLGNVFLLIDKKEKV